MRQDQEIEHRIDAMLAGKAPEEYQIDVGSARQAIEEATTEELEMLLSSPDIGLPENESIRDYVMQLLTKRCGAGYVTELVEGMQDQTLPWLQDIGGEIKDPDKKPVDRAKEAFAQFNCPLAHIMPEQMESFIVDNDGTFYFRLEQQEVVHFDDFDLVLAEEVSGTLEVDSCYDLFGVDAFVEANDQKIQMRFMEFQTVQDSITIITDHPLARLVQLDVQDFMFAVLTTE